MFKKLLAYFLQGVLYLVPITATIYVVVKAVFVIDGWVPVDIPGLGLLIIVVILTLVGFLGESLLLKNIFNFDRLLEKVPLLKIIYTAVKDLLSAFVGKKKRFTQPVLVKMEGEVERLGFITQENLADLGISSDKVGVYIPFSYAVTGNFIVVPKNNITHVKGKPADIMKFIISGGVTEIES